MHIWITHNLVIFVVIVLDLLGHLRPCLLLLGLHVLVVLRCSPRPAPLLRCLLAELVDSDHFKIILGQGVPVGLSRATFLECNFKRVLLDPLRLLSSNFIGFVQVDEFPSFRTP
jgi:hypothetical protein